MSPSAEDRVARIHAYFASCNADSASGIAAHFTPAATIYDTNHAPVRGAEAIGEFWDRIRKQWKGAEWGIDRVVSDGSTAAIEWFMRGESPDGPFIFRGSEHYAFEGELISEIRQYWTFDPSSPDTGLRDYPWGQA